jgi:hypothetical protein
MMNRFSTLFWRLLLLFSALAMLFFWARPVANRDGKKELLPENKLESEEMPPILMPPLNSKLLLLDEQQFEKALKAAEDGDLDFIDGLIGWYSRKGDVSKADFWRRRSDEFRAQRGMPSRLDSFKPTEGSQTVKCTDKVPQEKGSPLTPRLRSTFREGNEKRCHEKRCQALCMIPFPFPEEQNRVLEAVLGMKP